MLAPFLDASDALSIAPAADGARPEAGAGRFQAVEDRFYDRVRGTYGHLMPAAVVGGIAVTFIAAPLALVAAIGGVIWAALGGWTDTGEKRRRSAQQALTKHLNDELRRVQQHFFDVDLASGRSSPVDEWFATVEAAVTAHVGTIVTHRLEQARGEYERARREATLNEQQRREEGERTRRHLEAWDGLGAELTALAAHEDVDAALERLRRRQLPATESALATVEG